MYEELGLIPKAIRKPNGYRVFSDVHIDQFRMARIAFQIELLQGGMRKIMIQAIKLSTIRDYDKAISLVNKYIAIADAEIVNANEAAEISTDLLKKSFQGGPVLKRRDVSELLGISMDTLRNWEMNGLIKIKRKENGYRTYNFEDIKYIKVIRSLRCANYSLSSILRMMNATFNNKDTDVKKVLNTPDLDEDIVSVCDKLVVSLNSAKENANRILVMLHEMKSKY